MIEVSLLGKFEFLVNGKNAEHLLSSTRKGSQMLLHLLLNYGRPVSSTTLYELLWPNETSSNPESALKTLVSRTRGMLTDFDPDLRNCISTDHGAYRWNTELDAHIDVFLFEDASNVILNAAEANDDVHAAIHQMLTSYGGDLVGGREEDSWFISRRTFYHSLFLQTVDHALSLLRAKEEYEQMIRVCRAALDVDAFEETLHTNLMEALIKTNRSNEAMAQYRHLNNLHNSFLGMHPSENLQNYYELVGRTEQSLTTDLNAVRRYLTDSANPPGAFVCDYSILRDVYQLQMRNLERLGISIYVALIMLTPVSQPPVDAFEQDKAMHQLLSTMISCLRKGDTIARYSPSQFVLLLPSVNASTGKIVVNRIRNAYYNGQVNPALVFSYKLLPVKDETTNQKEGFLG